VIQVLPEQPGDVDRTCADISKARSLLGYAPKVTFEEGIRKTSDWYKTAFESGLIHGEGEAGAGGLGGARSGSAGGGEQEGGLIRGLPRAMSDLELSSFVEKAPGPLRDRALRILSFDDTDSSPREKTGK
jgi:GDP-mannose 4,6 dehydratase